VGPIMAIRARREPDLENLRDDPRFQELTKEVIKH
jgi:hypothetical protein